MCLGFVCFLFFFFNFFFLFFFLVKVGWCCFVCGNLCMLLRCCCCCFLFVVLCSFMFFYVDCYCCSFYVINHIIYLVGCSWLLISFSFFLSLSPLLLLFQHIFSTPPPLSLPHIHKKKPNRYAVLGTVTTPLCDFTLRYKEGKQTQSLWPKYEGGSHSFYFVKS